MLTSEEYQKWWEENKERVLSEDQLNHDLNFKKSVINNLDDVELINENVKTI